MLIHTGLPFDKALLQQILHIYSDSDQSHENENQEKLIDGNLDGGGRPKANNVRRRCNICLLRFFALFTFFVPLYCNTRKSNHFFPADCFRQTFTISLGLLRYATLALTSCFKPTFDVTVPRNMLSFRAMVEI